MTKGLEPALAKLAREHARGRRLALLFDYDGTLVPIVPRPRLATLDRRARRVLERLARISRVRIGILSGRMIDELEAMVPLAELCFAGTAGLELDLDGKRLTHPEARRAAGLVPKLARRLETAIRPYEGAWLEPKPLGLTLHYRGVADDQVAKLRTSARAALPALAVRLRIVDGPKALEITPELGWSKGTALRRMVEHLGAEGPGTLYAGDSANDAEALETVNAMGGISIGIGPDAPQAAQLRLPDPASLIDFLCRLRDALK